MISLLLLLCLLSSLQDSNAVASCQLLPTSGLAYYPASNPCEGVVDYYFYLPNGYTFANMSQKAFDQLSNTGYAILSAGCKSALLNLVCSNVYLRCIGTTIATTSTAAYSPYPVPLPFKRPCKSLCTSIATTCSKLLPTLGKTLNCDARYAYVSTFTLYKPFQYDSSNVASSCNIMSTTVALAGSAEPYLKASSGGQCTGITTSIYLPPAHLVDSTLAPFQKPYVLQSIIETKLATGLSELPSWLTPECEFALRKHLCTSAYLAPSQKVFGPILSANGFSFAATGLNSTTAPYTAHVFYLPSYPSQSICTNFESKCSGFLSLENTASLKPNCSTANTYGTKYYPTGDQAVATLTVNAKGPLSSFVANISVTTTANTASAAASTSGYSTQCPPGFVVPDNPTDPDTNWITGSGCATACRLPIFTYNEYHYMNNIAKYCAGFGLPMAVLLIIMMVMDPVKRTQHPVLTFAVASVINSIFFIVSTSDTLTVEEKFCRDNANPLNAEDGATFCAVQSVVVEYVALVAVLSWTMECWDIFDYAFFDGRHAKHWIVQLVVTITLPIASLLYTSIKGTFGYNQISMYCSYSPEVLTRKEDYITFHIPVLIMICASFTMITLVGVKWLFFRRSFDYQQANTELSKEAYSKRWSTVASTLLFVGSFFILFLSVSVLRLETASQRGKVIESFKDWTACVFQYFDEADPTNESWILPCGEYPSFRPRPRTQFWYAFCSSCASILLSVIYLHEMFRWFSRRTGFKDELKKEIEMYFPSQRQLSLAKDEEEGGEGEAVGKQELGDAAHAEHSGEGKILLESDEAGLLDAAAAAAAVEAEDRTALPSPVKEDDEHSA